MTRPQAKAAIAARANNFLAFPVTLRYGDQIWTLTLSRPGRPWMWTM